MENKQNLEEYSFLWSEARLVIAAFALFLGGIPVVYVAVPVPALFGVMRIGLTLAWIISGAASVYLLYEWNKGGRMLFGKKDQLDMWAFLIAMVTGLNLGLAGLFGVNIGMSIASGRIIFLLAGVIYLAVALRLWQRWNGAGKKLF